MYNIFDRRKNEKIDFNSRWFIITFIISNRIAYIFSLSFFYRNRRNFLIGLYMRGSTIQLGPSLLDHSSNVTAHFSVIMVQWFIIIFNYRRSPTCVQIHSRTRTPMHTWKGLKMKSLFCDQKMINSCSVEDFWVNNKNFLRASFQNE